MPGSLLDESFRATAESALRLRGPVALDPEARDQALAHAVLTTLLVLAGSGPAGSSPLRFRNKVFSWFEEEIERSFTGNAALPLMPGVSATPSAP